jgi:hypothetical protein
MAGSDFSGALTHLFEVCWRKYINLKNVACEGALRMLTRIGFPTEKSLSSAEMHAQNPKPE